MDIKINRKPPMTDVGQREAFSELVCEIKNHVNKFHNTLHMDFVDEAMEICHNDPQEIESIETTTNGPICIYGDKNQYTYLLTLDQYNQIKAAVESSK